MKTNEINAARAANGLAPLPVVTFTADESRMIAAYAHEQAHAARASGNERLAQEWERQAFAIEPPAEYHLV